MASARTLGFAIVMRCGGGCPVIYNVHTLQGWFVQPTGFATMTQSVCVTKAFTESHAQSSVWVDRKIPAMVMAIARLMASVSAWVGG
mmetsp:Transcript_30877/g.49829  ORF Transcript_30877/g.49829 Transcript_30877/m.49829 type:complete len:87 (-) Transcript_30877:860-1120(-)